MLFFVYFTWIRWLNVVSTWIFERRWKTQFRFSLKSNEFVLINNYCLSHKNTIFHISYRLILILFIFFARWGVSSNSDCATDVFNWNWIWIQNDRIKRSINLFEFSGKQCGFLIGCVFTLNVKRKSKNIKKWMETRWKEKNNLKFSVFVTITVQEFHCSACCWFVASTAGQWFC